MQARVDATIEIARAGGALALDYFRRVADLQVEDKGPQDFVSEADRAVEEQIRALIADAFPEDGIVGEEHETKPSISGYTWVIDPIDGTANFVTGIPAWVVVLAVVHEDQTIIGAIFDPIHDEMYLARRGGGATLNGKPISCPPELSMGRGSVAVGFARRTPHAQTVAVLEAVLDQGGVFFRNASGALMLAYVSAGRLIGYLEGHMRPWDCLAGQLLVSEAGGRIEPQSANDMVQNGGRVVAGSAGVFDDLLQIANTHYKD